MECWVPMSVGTEADMLVGGAREACLSADWADCSPDEWPERTDLAGCQEPCESCETRRSCFSGDVRFALPPTAVLEDDWCDGGLCSAANGRREEEVVLVCVDWESADVVEEYEGCLVDCAEARGGASEVWLSGVRLRVPAPFCAIPYGPEDDSTRPRSLSLSLSFRPKSCDVFLTSFDVFFSLVWPVPLDPVAVVCQSLSGSRTMGIDEPLLMELELDGRRDEPAAPFSPESARPVKSAGGAAGVAPGMSSTSHSASSASSADAGSRRIRCW